MVQTVRAERVDEKNGVICLVSILLPELWSVYCPKKCNFYNFVLTLARNLFLLKQFTYMHLKVSLHSFRKWYGL